MLVPLLRLGLGVGLHVQVPTVQLDHDAVLHVGQYLCDGFISVSLQQEDTQRNNNPSVLTVVYYKAVMCVSIPDYTSYTYN